MSINVTVTTNNDVVVGVGTAFQAQVPQLLVTAGKNVTVTTAAGSFTVIGRDVPVQSVQGRTGAVVITRADLTAAQSIHQHVAADISNLSSVANVVSVNGRTGVVSLNSAGVSAASAVHAHVASDVLNLTAVANVVSINGRTGVVTMNSSGVSAASAVHTHVVANVLDFTSVANVVSLNGITGTPSIVAGGNITVATAASSIVVTAGGADLSDATPQPLGVQSAGGDSRVSRSDHVHQMPTAADVGALDENSEINGGDYVGVTIAPSPTITIVQHPQPQSVTVGGVSETTAQLPSGTWGAIARIDTQVAGSPPTWFISGYQSTQADYYATSTDGINFTKRFGLPVAGIWSQFRYENGIYATRAGSTVAYSQNGITWSSTSLAAGVSGRIFGASGLFLADTTSGISYSTNAQSWSHSAAWSYSGALAFGRAGGYFFAAALNTGIRASQDGATWGSVRATTGIAPLSGQSLNAIPFGSAVYVGGSTFRPVRFDLNSQTWSQLTIGGTTSGGGELATNGSVLVFLNYGSGSDRIFTSTNGSTWVARPLPSAVPSGSYASLFYAEGRFVLLLRAGVSSGVYSTASQGTVYFTSTNGIDWQQATRTFGSTAISFFVYDGSQYAEQKGGGFNRVVFGGSSGVATFTAEASYSGGVVAYQWQLSADAGSTWSNISGAVLPQLTLSGVTSADNGKRYRAVVSASGASSVNTNPATLTVI